MTAFKELFAMSDEVSASFGGEIPEMLREAMEQNKKEKKERQLKAVASLINGVVSMKNQYVEQLRAVRKAEKAAKEALSEMERASTYFAETGNFGPLYKYMPGHVNEACRLAGVSKPTEEDKKIPEGWKPKS